MELPNEEQYCLPTKTDLTELIDEQTSQKREGKPKLENNLLKKNPF